MSQDNSQAIRHHQEIMAKQSLFAKHVQALYKALDGVSFIVLASDDGFPISHTLTDDKEAARKSAITASLGGLSSSIAHESGLKQAVATTIECDDGLIFSRNIQLDDHKSVELLVACNRNVNYAISLWTIKNTITDIITEFNR